MNLHLSLPAFIVVFSATSQAVACRRSGDKPEMAKHLGPAGAKDFLMQYVLLFFVCLLMSSSAGAGEPAGPVFRIGEFSVHPILDRDSAMKADLFSGPLSPEERLRFMPGGQAPASVNIFLIKSPAGLYLIDSGWGPSPGGEKLVQARLEKAGVRLEDIDLVFLTHMHPDHIGGLLKARAPALPKARIWVNKAEFEFWLSAANKGRSDEKGIQGRLAAAYEGRIDLFEPGREIVPGLTAIEASGHTPGHTVFSLKSGGAELLFIGDLIHAAALQFPKPDECAGYDQDRVKAVESRRRILSLAADGGRTIAGAHIPFPGLGTVAGSGPGYSFNAPDGAMLRRSHGGL